MGAQFAQNYLCLLVGRAKAHIPGVLIMFREEEPRDRLLFAESNGHTNCARFMSDSYTQSPTHSTSWLFWWGLERATGVFGGRVHLPSLPSIQPASNRCCLPTASAQSGPTAGSPTNPTIQHNTTSKLRIICESYPRIIPSNHIPPIQTSRPDYGKNIHTHISLCSPHGSPCFCKSIGSPNGAATGAVYRPSAVRRS